MNGWAPKFEPLPPIEDKALPSKERPPKLELKLLPSHLKYAFLGVEETFPVIISSSLELDQEHKTFGDIENPPNCPRMDNCRY